jgi:FdhD protein
LNLNPQITEIELRRFQSGHISSAPDQVAREEPLEIRVRGQSIAVTMRTPGHDRELAAGFLVSEGLLRKRSQIIEIAHCTTGEAAQFGNIINIFLAPDVQFDSAQLTRHVFASSSCGLCGKASIESVHQHFPPITSQARVCTSTILWLPKALAAGQETFSRTGGLHAAALFDLSGKLIAIHEDVGRHNAVDKIIGSAFLAEKLPLAEYILMVSGRTSFEIMQKASAGGIPIVVAVSAPSSLAVEFARESNQTLIGFLRGESFNIYSGSERVEGGNSQGNKGG